MKHKKEDRRVVRTKRDLKDAFFTLLNEKNDIEKVSIVDITEKANYNRATFYVHYLDKQSLIDEIIDETLDGFLAAFREPYKQIKTLELDKVSIQAIQIFKYIEGNSEIFRLLFTNKAFKGFNKKFSSVLEELFLTEVSYFDNQSQYFEKINKELFVRAQSYSMIGIISYWVEHNFIYSADFMNEQLLMITRYYDSTKITFVKP